MIEAKEILHLYGQLVSGMGEDITGIEHIVLFCALVVSAHPSHVIQMSRTECLSSVDRHQMAVEVSIQNSGLQMPK
jgi:hypothetical protein